MFRFSEFTKGRTNVIVKCLCQRTRLNTIIDSYIRRTMISFNEGIEDELRFSVEHSAPLSF